MKHSEAVTRATSYIERNLREEIDMAVLASNAGYAPSQFYVVFTKAVGQTPAEYIRNRRLSLSCWDLVFSRYKILDIAMDHQFSSQEAFTRAFEKRFGITPGKFRSQVVLEKSRRRKVITMPDKVYDKQKMLDGVMRVGFYKGGDQCPEDVPFPSCMAAVMRYLGEDYPWIPLEAHNMTWRLNFANIYFFGVSGMSFGFLWREGWHEDNVDHMFVADPREVIDRAFKSAGYYYRTLEKQDKEKDEQNFKASIIESINRGVPVLAFGVIGPPECCIITGYEDHGDTLLGLNYFQEDPGCNKGVEILENGYFRKNKWFEDTWSLIVIEDKFSGFDRAFGTKAILTWALRIMNTKELFGRHSGFAALKAWERHILKEDEFAGIDDTTLERKHRVHNSAVGMLAESRAWANSFVCHLAEKEPSMKQELEKAGDCFNAIHDLMWEMWHTCGGWGNPEAWRSFRDLETRTRLAEILRKAIELDSKAAALMEKASSI
jgi:AraC-like DNA-binding protein